MPDPIYREVPKASISDMEQMINNLQNSKLTDQKYWTSFFGKEKFFPFNKGLYEKWYNRYLKPDPNKTCIEIGAFPGANLGYLAKHFLFKPIALDFINNIDFIKANMEHNGIYHCDLIKQDFLSWQPESKYNIVCSHGFVEHFSNHEEIIRKHVEILRDDGIIFLSVPHFRYFQSWIRKFLYTEDYYNQVMSSHNLEIMELGELKRLLFGKYGLREVFSGYIRGMSIWFSPDPHTIKRGRIVFYVLLKIISVIVSRLGISNKYVSPEILVIGSKTSVP